jgi:hypothetical protein
MPALERDVRAASGRDLVHGRDHVDLARFEDVLGAGDPGLSLRAATDSNTTTCSTPVALSTAVVTRPIGPAPDERRVLRSGAGQAYGVVVDGQRLDEGPDLRPKFAQRVDPPALGDDELQEAAASTRQADEATAAQTL